MEKLLTQFIIWSVKQWSFALQVVFVSNFAKYLLGLSQTEVFMLEFNRQSAAQMSVPCSPFPFISKEMHGDIVSG